jgi:HEAT repeat protein
MHPVAHKLAALVVCLCVAPLWGCAQGTGGWFARNKNPEEALHIKTPDDRIKELKQLAATAKGKKPEEQQRIVDELAKEFQRENDPMMRRQILRTLAVYPRPGALATIVSALADGEMETRRIACASLGIYGGKEAVQELTRVISSDTNLDVRLAAARAMGHAHDASAMLPLVEAMTDPDPAMQACAHNAMAAVSGRDYGDNVRAWREYAMTGKSEAPQVSLAERMRRSFD